MDATAMYIALLRAFVIDHNALGEEELLSLLNEKTPVRIFDYWDLRLTPEDRFAFRKAFEKIPPTIDWPLVQAEVEKLIARVRKMEIRAEVAREKTARRRPLKLRILWCGKFTRPGLNARLFSPGRRYFYQAPSLFLGKMRDSGYELAYLRFDEDLKLGDLDGTQTKLHETADILYP